MKRPYHTDYYGVLAVVLEWFNNLQNEWRPLEDMIRRHGSGRHEKKGRHENAD